MSQQRDPTPGTWAPFNALAAWQKGRKAAHERRTADAARFESKPIDNEGPTPPVMRTTQNNFTVRVEVFRVNHLTQKPESYLAIGDCKGVGPIEALENLLAQLQSGAVQLK
jgi:hypothetical protein